MNSKFTILEKGDIYFFYRPKVNTTVVKSKADVGKFFFTLHAHSSNNYRMIIIGKKQLPGSPRVEFAFVSKVATHFSEVEEFLKEYRYQTKTRGERSIGPAHLVGEGTYLFLNLGKVTHFVYLMDRSEELARHFLSASEKS